MLKTLTIQNFAIIDHVHLEFDDGLSVITGETGAGKSILIGAFNIVLGQRIQSHFIKNTGERMSVIADFDIEKETHIHKWLAANELDSGDDCILRRTMEANGRARTYINNIQIPILKLKELSNLLVDTVGQNTHQFLLHKKNHLAILDAQCAHPERLEKMKNIYMQWMNTEEQLATYRKSISTAEEKLELLKYQVQELNEFAPQDKEFETIEQDHRRLSKIDALAEQTQKAQVLLSGDDEKDICSGLTRLSSQLEPYCSVDPNISTAKNEMDTALSHLEIATDEIKTALNNINLEDRDFHDLETRMSKYMDLARKYQVAPAQLAHFHQELCQKLQALEDPGPQIEALEKKLEEHKSNYQNIAEKVSKKRYTVATSLGREVSKTLQKLNMQGAEFSIAFEKNLSEPCGHGLETVEFMIKTNVGQTLNSMTQIASGGELSRINLAIQTALTKSHPITTVVFDEIDAGIGGETAETIGQLLQQLSCNMQVLCITHLPQIAAHAHCHYRVDKNQKKNQTIVSVTKLSNKERDYEIARMLAGTKVNANTLAHARNILDH